MTKLSKRLIAPDRETPDHLPDYRHPWRAIEACGGLFYFQVEPDDNGSLLITCPGIPEVSTFATDEGEVEVRAVAALEEAFAARGKGHLDGAARIRAGNPSPEETRQIAIAMAVSVKRSVVGF